MYQNRLGFVDDVIKTFWFEFVVSQFQFDVYLQNARAKFDKVVYRHYSGEVEKVYITLWQIYSGQHVPNFVRIGHVFIQDIA